MVERVARGRIIVPAAMALGAVSAGLLAAGPADAGGRDTTLQIRVEVVEPCRIRLLPGGALDQACGRGAPLPASVAMSELVARFEDRAAQHFPRVDGPAKPLPAALNGKGLARATAANQRASGVAAGIAERVRFITVTY